MEKEKKQTTKQKAIIWASIYFVLTLAIVVSSALVFHTYYYQSIFIYGNSMAPTFKGGVNKDKISDFGIADPTLKARKNLERFDIVTCYYPWEDYEEDGITLKKYAELKIKRLIAFPGETVSVDGENGLISISHGSDYLLKFNTTASEGVKALPYKRLINGETFGRKSLDNFTLEEDEYFVMGDNWTKNGSSDCASNEQALKFDNITAKLVAIEGTCTIDGSSGKRKCINRKYTGFKPY